MLSGKLKSLPSVLLAAVIIIQVFYLFRMGTQEKKEYHCDEVYSYGLANGFYQPFIESGNIRSFDFHYVDEWVSGEVYRNYLTVQENQRFRYDSVWYNQSQDRHPPLFYAVLHTVCSFFPDTFSPWFGMIPNLIYFAVTQYFLYRLSKNVLKSRYLALLVILFFGFTPAAVNNTLFIRMYCMLVMWGVIFMYLHSRLAYVQKENFFRDFLPITVITALGALTQYVFLFMAFATAVCFCFWYLLRKKYKIFWIYGLSMLSGVLMMFAVFPASIQHLFTEGSGVGRGLDEQLVIAVRYLFFNVFCMNRSNLVWLLCFLPPMVGILTAMALPVLFLFRDRLKGTKAKINAKWNRMKKGFHRKPFASLKESIKSHPEMIAMIAMLASVVTVMVIVSYTVSFMGKFADRYFFIICPFAAVLILGGLYWLLSKVRFSRILAGLLTLLLSVNVMARSSLLSAWTYENTMDLHDTLSDGNVIFVLKSPDEYSILSTLSYELYHAENVFVTNFQEKYSRIEKTQELVSDKPFYLVLPSEYFDMGFDGYIRHHLLNHSRLLGEYHFMQGEFFVYQLYPVT